MAASTPLTGFQSPFTNSTSYRPADLIPLQNLMNEKEIESFGFWTKEGNLYKLSFNDRNEIIATFEKYLLLLPSESDLQSMSESGLRSGLDSLQAQEPSTNSIQLKELLRTKEGLLINITSCTLYRLSLNSNHEIMAQYEDEFNASICLSPPPNPSDGPREIFKKLLKTITDECNVITQDADVYTLSFDASGEITATFKERAPIPNRFHLTPIPSNRDPIPLSYLVSCNSVQFAKKTGECYRLELDSDGKIIARFTKKIKTNSPEDTKPSYSSSCKFMTIALLGVISVVALSVFQGLHSQHEL